jgi:phosphatidylinositol glycan class W
MIDYLFCILPLVSILTILNEWKNQLSFLFMFFITIFYLKITKAESINLNFFSLNSNKSSEENSKIKTNFNSIEVKIVRLSISTCRLWLYLLTCVTILAVDFHVYPRHLAKTETYGVSLMDLGVGFYIVVHSMRLIRNNENQSENTYK